MEGSGKRKSSWGTPEEREDEAVGIGSETVGDARLTAW
jgi:hypothetical protein